MIGYPGYHGLPEWEPARLILENQLDFEGREFDIGDVKQILYFQMSLQMRLILFLILITPVLKCEEHCIMVGRKGVT